MKVVRERINYSNLQPAAFKEKFRLRQSEADFVLSFIGDKIKHRTTKNKALSPTQQLLTALHWYGNGSQYHGAADMHGISKSTVCRVLKRVTAAIVDTMFQKFVKWPENPIQVAADFYNVAEFPSVCGVVDGTLIPIDAPSENEQFFVDRHGNHSLNAMMISGPDCTFYCVNSGWPGSVHDSRVLRRSYIGQKFEAGWRPFNGAVLLGKCNICRYI